MAELYNVYAVRIDNGDKRIIAEGKSKKAAEAISDMAAMRRGVDVEYFTVEEAD